MSRVPRYPLCRMTAFTGGDPDGGAAILPLLREADRVYREACPGRYAVQRAAVDRTSADFVIAGTAFTTFTANATVRTTAHRDKGDLKEGFGVMTVIEKATTRAVT